MTDPRTDDVLAAMRAVFTLVEQHDLAVSHIDITPSQSAARAYNAETGQNDLPVLPKVVVSTPWQSAADFVRWCDALGVTVIQVERREHDTVLWAHARLGGFSWAVSGYLSRPAGGGPRLPGAAVEWERNDRGRTGRHGRTTVADLRIALTALGEE